MSPSLFNAAAGLYGWMTSQSAWRESCAGLLPDVAAGAGQIKVLDLGCGPGVSSIELARRKPEALVVGVDLARRMLQQARRRGDQVSPRLCWCLADAARLPFQSGSFDLVTGHSFLYLVRDPGAVLRECLRVLRPGGRVRLMEPSACGSSPREVLKLSKDPRFLLSVMLWRPFSRWYGRFDPARLAAVLREAGFQDCDAEHSLGGLGVLGTAVRPLRGMG